MDNLKGLCPKCGETLEVPGHLKQFSCMYCGARLSPAELVSDQPTQVLPEIDGAACAEYYRSHILKAVAEYTGIEKEVTRDAFVPAFERYTNGNAETFRQLEWAVNTKAITLDAAANSFLDQLEQRWDAEASWKKSRTNVMETDKFILAIFLVPMVRRMQLSISEEYCAVLRELWCSRYPKSIFNLGNYDDIANGFQKKFLGLCFITTAVCLHEGKADDCEELTAFRGFRDNYLRACPDGPALIDEYYNIAPGIVLRIDLSDDRDARYAAIRKNYLQPCYDSIRSGDWKACKDRYIQMVRSLEQEYLN